MWLHPCGRPAGVSAAAVGVFLVVTACNGVSTAPPGKASAASTSQLSLAASATCTNTQVVAGWSLRRQARQTIVVPVQETDVAAVGTEVAAGVGGVILFGSKAPTDLRAQLQALTGQALGGGAALGMTRAEGGGGQRGGKPRGGRAAARAGAAPLT